MSESLHTMYRCFDCGDNDYDNDNDGDGVTAGSNEKPVPLSAIVPDLAAKFGSGRKVDA